MKWSNEFIFERRLRYPGDDLIGYYCDLPIQDDWHKQSLYLCADKIYELTGIDSQKIKVELYPAEANEGFLIEGTSRLLCLNVNGVPTHFDGTVIQFVQGTLPLRAKVIPL